MHLSVMPAPPAAGPGPVEAGALAAVVGIGVAYATGIARLRASAAGRRALPRQRALALLGGWTALAAGLAPPVSVAADARFAAHMAQHELFLLVAPPLLVLGRPMLVSLWALPAAWRRRMSRPLRRPGAAAAWGLFTAPLAAFGLHAAALWLWHVVPAFEAALRDEAVHLVQHASFVASACLFWWALFHGRFGRLGYGAGVLFVFGTAVHSGALGALLLFAPRAWYPTHEDRAAAAGIDPVLDQQLGGVLMWIPAGLVLLVLALALFAAWMAAAARRVRAT